jgi:hypothetical protein
VRVSLSDPALAETILLRDPSRNHACHELSRKLADERA